ncbi:hypothetical protein [Phenylobacterium deserti]|uniref:Uncharacterized protein n=1 Tax=Phenylobacterium deserti TaxID=1914756 RepID=A0A328A815_9CAUL|nr:hypothetical protein [Phenylobacterium deserti]RAK50672.1 hypothetical protein DJ018_18855 [Phenylobacterium deserti]
MQTARRRRIVVVGLSAVAHAVVGTLVALHAPQLIAPQEDAGPPFPVIPVLIQPIAPPRPGSTKPEPIRLHRRLPRNVPITVPLEPLPEPEPEAPVEAPPAPRPAVRHPAPLPQAPSGDLRAALRSGPVGCGNREATGLNRAEREACDQRLGTGVDQTRPLDLALPPMKDRAFDAAAARKRAYREYRDAPAVTPSGPGPGSSGDPSKPRDLDPMRLR